MSNLGTWDWAQATGGRLRRRDRLEMLRQGVAARLAQLPEEWRGRMFGAGAPLSLPDPPDSALARDAEELVCELSSPALFGHCLRTWAFAELFALRDGVARDPELLFLACVLHDLGLTEAHDRRDSTAGCFAVEGARAAEAMLSTRGMPADRARTVAEAISLHLNVSVPARLGAEAHLLSKGAALDVVGRRLQQLPAPALRSVEQRWPRGRLAGELCALTSRQGEIRPQSRVALLNRLGFAGLIDGNPLNATATEGVTADGA